MTSISLCPYGHAHCRGRGLCGIERWGWRNRRPLVKVRRRRWHGLPVGVTIDCGEGWYRYALMRRWRPTRWRGEWTARDVGLT
jgi:hypothetical protein